MPDPEDAERTIDALARRDGGEHVARLELIRTLQDDGFNLESRRLLEMLRPLGDGRYEDLSPRLGRAGEELTALGVAPDDALAAVERLRERADAVSQLFVELFLAHVWRPFDAAGRPPERWPEVREALERLRPLAGDALMAVFGLAMGDAVEDAFGAVLGEPAEGG